MDQKVSTEQLAERMRIVCERTGTAVPASECIECAQTAACLPPAFIKAVLDHVAADRDGIHVSDVIGCLRRAYYSKTVEKEPGRPSDHIVTLLGTLVHEALDRFQTNGEMPLKVTSNGVTIVGRADCFENGVLRDTKTTRWMKVERLPYGNHKDQVLLYAAMLREMGETVKRVFINYIDLSGPSRCPYCKQYSRDCTCNRPHNGHNGFYPYEVEFDKVALDEALDKAFVRAQLLQTALNTGQPPKRPARYWLCDYCDFSERCWE